jgi:thioredoxin 2
VDARIVQCANCGRRNRVPAAATGVPHCGNCHAPLSWVADAGDDSFPDVVEASTVPVLVDLWAPWCGPCRQVSPALEQLAQERAGQVKLVKVNVDEAPKVSERFVVQAVPTLLILRGGRVLARQAGAAPIQTLRTWLDDTLRMTDSGPPGGAGR